MSVQLWLLLSRWHNFLYIDDVLKLHFMKRTKVVVMETADRVQLSVPLSSYLKFSFLYDPNNNMQEARRGFK